MEPATPSGGQPDVGIQPNIAGLLCYLPCCGLLLSAVAVIVERRNAFVRFHSLQGLLLNGTSLVVLGAFSAAEFLLGWFNLGTVAEALSWLKVVVLVGTVVLDAILMLKAYDGEEYALPVFGALGRQWV